ncbi:hypothetical protein SPURM210S_02835 [Streptomyces purpurascens]
MFCVAFGLSMDYGVFLLSRIKEEYDHTGDHDQAVRHGLARTGGLITAAAVILAVVMVAIGTSRVTNTKMLGLGIALAVLMDAMIVRSLLVPAVMPPHGPRHLVVPGSAAPLPRALRPERERTGTGEGDGRGQRQGRSVACLIAREGRSPSESRRCANRTCANRA